MRVLGFLAATALLVTTAFAGVVQPGPAAADTIPSVPVTWCGTGTPTYPCVAALSVDGTPVTAADPHWSFNGTSFSLGGATYASFTLLRDDSATLGAAALDDVVVVDLATGPALLPRVVSGKARDVTVTRTSPGGVHEIVVTGTPVVVSGQCDQSVWPWVCPEYTGTDPDLDAEWIGYFDVQVSDNGQWTDATQREAFLGMHYFTNVAATDIPPQVRQDAAGNDYLLITLANRHFRSDGTTEVQGHGELRIPSAFLKQVYGVPDPASMTTAGLDPSLSGSGAGTLTVTQEPGGGAMLVTYDGVTFSRRVLQVRRGVVTPTRPTAVSAVRTAANRGRVRFSAATPRGAKVTGYRVRCVPPRGATVQVSAPRSPVAVPGLTRGVRYTCKVRATSKSGAGPWSIGAPPDARP
ncbi:MAG TPA: fibronectin type III domain-containing protein [Nocardioides sp.]|uniref:fibronectin type III domain-containing protein n=1 Tax=Nocardioides sp. TaxID=35761 RepID=UPI002D138AC4|nr:fibronectin type III domain-containing protein [Nocardioides sp.]HQR27296.1 fibronectin type III domain-containing protein [Nocardioides sp.]